MPNIKPVSDLRNYNEVLRGVAEDEPVFLTKNGRGRYVLLTMQRYEALVARARKWEALQSAGPDGDVGPARALDRQAETAKA